MAVPEHLSHAPHTVPFRRRWAVRIASGLAAVLARRSPARIRRTLTWLARGARPGTGAEIRVLRDAVVAVSLPCAGREGCVRRSLAVVLLARASGIRADWCVGVRRIPPFGAHAWVEADGEPVGEDTPPDYFRLLVSVPPRVAQTPPPAAVREG